MRTARLLATLAALGLAFFAATASARSLRYPQTGDPAFLVEVPEDWTSRTDKGNCIVGSGDHALAFSLNIVTSTLPVDQIATKALEIQKVSPTPNRETVSIAGYGGVAYSWTASKADTTVDITLMIVRIDSTHIAICSTAVAGASSPEVRKIANWFVQDLQISRPAP